MSALPDFEAILPRVPDTDYAGHVDTCPLCMARGCAPSASTTVDRSTVCDYRCWACDTTWNTSFWDGGER